MPDLRVLTNIANPYNGALYDELNAIGCETEVLYKSEPAHEGRTWTIDRRPYERTTSPRQDFQSMAGDPSENTLLSGGYHRLRDILRLSVGALTSTRLSFWGERLRLERSSAQVRLVQRALLQPMSCVFAIGTWARESYRQLAPPGTPVHVFPYGLPAATVAPNRTPEPVFGYAGSLIARKGIGGFLAAVGALSGHRPRIDIVGSGPERQSLEHLGEQLGLDISWHEEVSSRKLNVLRSGWWAQVVPSRYDGWGMVVPEALAAGVPVIATDRVGAARDLVVQGVTGELVHSPSGLAAALSRLLDATYQAHLSGGARLLGRELVADRAAPWLVSVLKERPSRDESFLKAAMTAAGAAGLSRPERSR